MGLDPVAPRRLRGLSALLLLLGFGISPIPGSRPSEGAGDADRASLVSAVGERRLLRARVTGGFRFGPEPPRKRGSEGRLETPFEVLAAAASIRDRFDADPSPRNSGNLSLAYLFTGDWEKGTRLAEIRALEDEGAAALTDLSAAYIERGIQQGDSDDFARAFDAALRALRIQPGRPEALFNKALAADGIGLAWVAREAWDEYLRAQPDGPWAEPAREARALAARREERNDGAARERGAILEAWTSRRLDEVRALAVRRPDLAREVVRRHALPEAAQAVLDGRPAGPGFALARELNDLAEAADRDTMDREALDLLERGDLELASAHVEFARASSALDERRVDEGSPGVLHAAGVFKRKASPYAAQGELQGALVDFFHGRRDGLIRRYGNLIDRHRGRYPLLRARALWMRALCQILLASSHGQALADQEEALTILTDAGQPDLARQIAGQLRSTLAALGREVEAGRVLASVLSSVSREDASLRTLTVVETLTRDLQAKGLPLAALEVQKGMEESARRGGAIVAVNHALILLDLATGVGDEAVKAVALSSGSRALSQITDQEMRAEMEVLYSLARIDALPRSGTETIEELNQLLGRLRRRPNADSLRKALTLIGEMRVDGRSPDSARVALREALDLYLALRTRTPGAFERVRGFEAAERTADDLVDLLSRSAPRDEVLELLEELREPEAGPPLSLATLANGLADDEALVSYWLLKDRVLVDVAAHGSVQHIELPIRRETLRSLVHRTQASIDVQSAALVGKGLTDLHRLLVSPLTPALGSARRLVIIPDRELWNVPFPGLVAGPRSEPLAARYEITFAASLRAAARSRGPWTSPHSVLAIGSPLWDKARFSDLPLLPESAVEATRVATIYPRSRVLLGAAATRATVQRLAGGFDVIHLATHAVPNERNPGESFVLLAADQEDPGMWRASDPGWEALSGARLVVLSACRTGAERSRFGGASLGVLSSIQRSTTAQILASTGDVDDAASRRLLEAFHRRLSAGDTPAAALRLAQLDALKEPSGLTWMLYRIVV